MKLTDYCFYSDWKGLLDKKNKFKGFNLIQFDIEYTNKRWLYLTLAFVGFHATLTFTRSEECKRREINSAIDDCSKSINHNDYSNSVRSACGNDDMIDVSNLDFIELLAIMLVCFAYGYMYGKTYD